jgi:CrcB protein
MLLEGRLGVALLTATAHLGGSLFLTWLGIRSVQALAA